MNPEPSGPLRVWGPGAVSSFSRFGQIIVFLFSSSGFFHVPRCLYMCERVLDDLLANKDWALSHESVGLFTTSNHNYQVTKQNCTDFQSAFLLLVSWQTSSHWAAHQISCEATVYYSITKTIVFFFWPPVCIHINIRHLSWSDKIRFFLTLHSPVMFVYFLTKSHPTFLWLCVILPGINFMSCSVTEMSKLQEIQDVTVLRQGQ